MQIIQLPRFVASHPLNRKEPLRALSRLLRWQLASRLLRQPVALPFVGDTRLIATTGMAGATGNWYCGLHEPDDMGFVLHALRPDSLFLDVGANIGSYSVLAAGAVGARVIAVEPLPATFAHLQTNIRHNDLSERVHAWCGGLSSKAGELAFTSGLDSMNRVALPGDTLATTVVPVRTMDDLCGDDIPNVIKIDVEGHEAEVLAGGARTLANGALMAVIMETDGSGLKFGVSDEALVATMIAHGFTQCRYDAIHRQLEPGTSRSNNSIFVRDVAAMQARCRAAARYRLVNGSI